MVQVRTNVSQRPVSTSPVLEYPSGDPLPLYRLLIQSGGMLRTSIASGHCQLAQKSFGKSGV